MHKAIVIDNNPRTKSLLTKILEDKCLFEVKSYDFIKISIPLIKYFNPVIIFIDQPFPRLEHFSFLKELKADKDTKTIPIVVMLNKFDKKFIDSLADLGIYEILFKPYNLDEIVPRINMFINKFQNAKPKVKFDEVICNNIQPFEDILPQLNLIIISIIKNNVKKQLNINVSFIPDSQIDFIEDNMVYKCNYSDTEKNNFLSLSLIASEKGLINITSKIENITTNKWDEISLSKCKNIGDAIYGEVIDYLKIRNFDFIKNSVEININIASVLKNFNLKILFTTEDKDLFAFVLNYNKNQS
ncbi:MAG: response regulator [bacterium]